jgi:predicted house-cleaning noncanonical NTP pyrophosphatase (MazG superfamily)
MSFTHTMTNLPEENEYPKLVRDKIPEIVKSNEGIDVPTRTLDDDEYLAYLLKKVVEEATELSETKTDDHLVEEIADVYEIIDSIIALKNMQREDVLKVQDEKRQKRGGFDKRILMLGKE